MTEQTNHNNRHVVDILFVLSLFCVFAASALMLITLGSNIYEETVSRMERNYSARTSFAYIDEKIRQKDSYNAVAKVSFGDGDALVLSEIIEEETYQTILYLDNGYLKELFCKQDAHLSPSAGQEIMTCSLLEIEQIKENLYHITITVSGQEPSSIYIGTYSGKDGET